MSARAPTVDPTSPAASPRAMAVRKLSIIVPVYNEARYIRQVIDRIRRLSIPHEIIVVDDCSTDGTGEILKTLPETVRIVRHSSNSGKGTAIRSAIPHVTGWAVAIQDADLEYHPEELERLFGVLEREGVEAVYGSRFAGTIVGMKVHVRLANRFLTWLTNRLYGASLTDMETCYKVVRADVLRCLALQANRFEVEPEITAKLLRLGCRIHEVPIAYSARTVGAGKKIRWTDALTAIVTLMKCRRWRGTGLEQASPTTTSTSQARAPHTR